MKLRKIFGLLAALTTEEAEALTKAAKADRKTKWPWVLASEMLPTKSGHYVVCWEGQWHPAWFASETDAIHNEPFFEIRKMGQIVYLKVYKNRFDQLWWRTIELPEEE